MATHDLRDVVHDVDERDGAPDDERLLGAALRGSVGVLEDMIDEYEEKPEEWTDLINNSQNKFGEHVYHVAASMGRYDFIDLLLDQDNFECDPPSHRADHWGETPLHSAVRWINENPEERSEGFRLIEMMLASGNDPRIPNKFHMTPATLTDPSNKELRELLEQGERDRNEEEEEKKPKRPDVFVDYSDEVVHDYEADEKSEGSASDEDDQEEYQRYRAQKKAEKAAAA